MQSWWLHVASHRPQQQRAWQQRRAAFGLQHTVHACGPAFTQQATPAVAISTFLLTRQRLEYSTISPSSRFSVARDMRGTMSFPTTVVVTQPSLRKRRKRELPVR
jgi:hypothetical protein